MIIKDFTAIELNYLERFCNFDHEELKLFRMRSKGISLEQCAEKLNVSVSTVKRISGKVNRKIMKVMPT